MFVELALVIIVIAILLQYIHFGSKPPGTPPGTVGLPILGVLPPNNCSFTEHIDKYRKKYGETFWMKIGSRNVVIICDYEDIMIALNNPALMGRVRFLTVNTLHPRKQKGITFGDGADWRILRRFTVRNLRDSGMGKSSMSSIILKETETLVEDFERRVGKPEQLPMTVNSMTLNILWQLVAGQCFDVSDAKIYKFHTTFLDFFSQWQGKGMFLLDFMPWIGNWAPAFVQNLFGRNTFKQKADTIHEVLYSVVEEHKRTIDEDNPRDLIDSYLIQMKKLARDDNRDPDTYKVFSDSQLNDLIVDMYDGGSTTSSTVIRWYLLLMAKYPDVQKRVQEELDSVISRDGTISLDDKENLPYFESTIYECLRLQELIPVSIFRNAIEDTNISNYFIPKGTLILANFHACHRNRKFWEKPNEFYPEHFLNEDKTFDNKKKGLLPFSTGYRVCPGENLGKMTIFLMLGTLMQKFSFTAPEGEKLSLDQSPEQPFFNFPKPFTLIINKR